MKIRISKKKYGTITEKNRENTKLWKLKILKSQNSHRSSKSRKIQNLKKSRNWNLKNSKVRDFFFLNWIFEQNSDFCNSV